MKTIITITPVENGFLVTSAPDYSGPLPHGATYCPPRHFIEPDACGVADRVEELLLGQRADYQTKTEAPEQDGVAAGPVDLKAEHESSSTLREDIAAFLRASERAAEARKRLSYWEDEGDVLHAAAAEAEKEAEKAQRAVIRAIL